MMKGLIKDTTKGMDTHDLIAYYGNLKEILASKTIVNKDDILWYEEILAELTNREVII